MADPLLAVAGVSKSFGKLRVIEDITVSVATGSTLGIVGPNGAGKSTLLNLVNGVLTPDAGTIAFAGVDVTRHGAAARARAGVGRSYQVPRPFAAMTVLENVLVPARFARRRTARDSYRLGAAALEATGLADQANALAGSLRLLDRKRLELARALASDPRLLLLDEIAGGLTEHEVPALVGTIGDIKARGVTIVWIEHVVHALLAVADQLMCLTYGKVLAIGDPQDVMDDPEVRRVYLGSTPDESVA